MPSTSKIKFFKRVALLLTIIWTVVTYSFYAYQINNEKNHILHNTIEQAELAVKQSEQLLIWSSEQKLQAIQNGEYLGSIYHEALRDLVSTMSQKNKSTLEVEGNYLEDDFQNISSEIKDTIKKTQISKQPSYIEYTKDNQNYVYYIKPLLANKKCIECHIHNDKKAGDLLGNINTSVQIKTFKEVNEKSYYFLMISYLATWLTGLLIIWFIRYKSKQYFDEKIKNYEEGIYSLVDMMERRDVYTAGHSKRVAHYATLIAEKLSLSDDDCHLIFRAGMLHDIGKIEIPDALLLKPDYLTKDEYDLIKKHSKVGFELLSRDPFYDLASIVLHHHENYDGSGYPYGLAREQIPFLSQIIAVADVYDAVTTSRAYRKAMSKEEAIRILQEGKSKKFNPKIVAVAIEIFEDLELDAEIAHNSEDMIKEMKFSYYFKDPLTDCYNINYAKFLLKYKDNYKQIYASHVNFQNFTAYNKEYGWKQGDKFLKYVASTIMSKCKDCVVIRVFGDHFIILYFNADIDINKKIFKDIEQLHNLKAEFQHINLMEEGIDSFDKLADIIHSKN